MPEHPLYRCWRSMNYRCNRTSCSDYYLYGARGVRVCKEWEDFKVFAKDMGPRPPGRMLDRIDNDGPYAPWNCRWATPAEQQRNTRQCHYITIGGERLCATDWARKMGVTKSTVFKAIKRHGDEEAIKRMLAARPWCTP